MRLTFISKMLRLGDLLYSVVYTNACGWTIQVVYKFRVGCICVLSLVNRRRKLAAYYVQLGAFFQLPCPLSSAP